MSQRLLLYFGVCHSPRFVIFCVSGLREWDVFRVAQFPRECSPPNPLKRLSGESAVQFTPHHIFEWGAKTALADVRRV